MTLSSGVSWRYCDQRSACATSSSREKRIAPTTARSEWVCGTPPWSNRLEPAAEASDAARVVGALGELRQQTGGLVDVAGQHGVLERRLVVGTGSVPRRGAGVERLHPRLVSAAELGQEVLAQEVVISVPLLLGVERDQEEVRAREVVEALTGAIALHHIVAQRPAEPVEGGSVEHEGEVVIGQSPEDLGADVVGDEPSAHRRGRHRRITIGPSRPDRECRQVESGRPALGARVDRRDVFLGQLDASGAEQGGGLLVVELEVAGLDQGPASTGHDARDGQKTRGPTGQDDLRSGFQVARKCDQDVSGVGRGETVDVVEDEHERARTLGERRAESWNRGAPDRWPG